METWQVGKGGEGCWGRWPLKPKGAEKPKIEALRSHRTEGGDFIHRRASFPPPSSSILAPHRSLPLSSISLSLSLSPIAMASISVPCPKCSLPSLPTSRTAPSMLLPGSARFPSSQAFSQRKPLVLKAQAQKVAVESLNSSPLSSTKSEVPVSTGDNAEVVEKSASQPAISESTISAFMAEVADLVKLVDSRDITELQLKQKDCELIIRKKEALPQPPPAPYLMMQPPPQATISSQHPSPSGPPPSAPAPAPALPPPAKASSSSLPPLKCPMAGNFYRSPAPGEPPFVKVGDKVKKGQVICIIEAMKLMNEIEADQSGTIVEIIAEDGKPVSVDTPLLVIQP